MSWMGLLIISLTTRNISTVFFHMEISVMILRNLHFLIKRYYLCCRRLVFSRIWFTVMTGRQVWSRYFWKQSSRAICSFGAWKQSWRSTTWNFKVSGMWRLWWDSPDSRRNCLHRISWSSRKMQICSKADLCTRIISLLSVKPMPRRSRHRNTAREWMVCCPQDIWILEELSMVSIMISGIRRPMRRSRIIIPSKISRRAKRLIREPCRKHWGWR